MRRRVRLRRWTRCRRRLAWGLGSRRRSSYFLFWIVLSSIFGILLSAPFCNDFLLRRRLVLYKLDVRHLRSGRRRNQKEESENEASNDAREVEDIRSACRFRQFNNVFRIDLLALDYSCSVIRISCRICEICQEESHNDHRSRRSEVTLSQRSDQLSIWLHMKGLAE